MAKKLISPVILAAFGGLFPLSGLDVIWNWASPAHCGSLALPPLWPQPAQGKPRNHSAPFWFFRTSSRTTQPLLGFFQDTPRNDFAIFLFLRTTPGTLLPGLVFHNIPRNPSATFGFSTTSPGTALPPKRLHSQINFVIKSLLQVLS